MRRNRIALVCNSSWAMVNFRMNIMRALHDEGRELLVIAGDDGGRAALEREGIPFVPWEVDGRGTNPFAELFSIGRLFIALARFRPSICFNYTIKPAIYGSLAAPLLGIKAVALITGLGYVFLSHGLRSTLARELYRLALSFSAEVWFLNEDDRKVFIRRGLVRERKTHILPGEGIDTARFLPLEPRKPDGKTVFLMLSRLLYDKGVGEYFQAAGMLRTTKPDTVFRLAGALEAGSKSAVPPRELETLVADGTIEYLGKLADVRAQIAAADFVVLPSYREGLPRSLLEAAAMGIPLIATDVAGCRDVVVEGVNGFLAEARSAASLVGAMERAMRLEPAQARAMGAQGRAMVLSRYGDEQIVERYIKRLTDLAVR